MPLQKNTVFQITIKYVWLVSSFANLSGFHEFEEDMKKYKCWIVNFWTAELLCVIEYTVPFLWVYY